MFWRGEKKYASLLNNSVYTKGWRRPIGCLKLQLIFRKRATDYRALLRKMTHTIRHPMGLRHPVKDMCLSAE